MEESFAEGEAFIEAETNVKKPHHNENCLNCGTKLVDLLLSSLWSERYSAPPGDRRSCFKLY